MRASHQIPITSIRHVTNSLTYILQLVNNHSVINTAIGYPIIVEDVMFRFKKCQERFWMHLFGVKNSEMPYRLNGQ